MEHSVPCFAAQKGNKRFVLGSLRHFLPFLSIDFPDKTAVHHQDVGRAADSCDSRHCRCLELRARHSNRPYQVIERDVETLCRLLKAELSAHLPSRGILWKTPGGHGSAATMQRLQLKRNNVHPSLPSGPQREHSATSCKSVSRYVRIRSSPRLLLPRRSQRACGA